MSNKLLEFDERYKTDNIKHFAGVDEAGRGPLAGPVTAAAVIIEKENDLINDSKKLSEKKREKVYKWITENAVSWAVASVGVKKIDEINILNASLLAMEKAVSKLKVAPQKCLIDGNKTPKNIKNAEAVIKGDKISYCIAAASIVAKVTRDNIMRKWHKVYKNYHFDKHKGYGTKLHFESIEKHFPSPIHRLSFTPVSIFQFPSYPNRIKLGKWGENWAIYYLIRKGYKFVQRNYFAGKFGEIDVIMKESERYIFVEVKTKGPNDHYDVIETITRGKVAKMLKCSDHYFYNRKIDEFEVGFDAIIVNAGNWQKPEIEHLKDINY